MPRLTSKCKTRSPSLTNHSPRCSSSSSILRLIDRTALTNALTKKAVQKGINKQFRRFARQELKRHPRIIGWCTRIAVETAKWKGSMPRWGQVTPARSWTWSRTSIRTLPQASAASKVAIAVKKASLRIKSSTKEVAYRQSQAISSTNSCT